MFFRAFKSIFLANPASDITSRLYFINSKIDYLLQINQGENRKLQVQDLQKLITNVWENDNFSLQEEKIIFRKNIKNN